MSFVKKEVENRISFLKISRPEKLNALNTKVLEELKKTIERDCEDPSIDLIVLTGEGRFFSAGIDLEEVASSSSPEEASRPFKALADLLETMLSCKKIVVSFLNGPAVAGGAELMLASDVVFAVKDAWIQWPEALWNIIAPMLASVLERSPLPRLAYIALMGERLGVEEAINIGLISKVFDTAEAIKKELEKLLKISQDNPKAIEAYISVIRRSKKEVLNLVEEFLTLTKSQELVERARSFIKSRSRKA
jgi:enoyl-CoA hydratase/carnithine racemase